MDKSGANEAGIDSAKQALFSSIKNVYVKHACYSNHAYTARSLDEMKPCEM